MDRFHDSTDADLLERSSRDADAFAALYDRHAGVLHRWFRRRVDGDSTALELTAETFAQAWTSRVRFQPPVDGSAGPWLQGIAANLHRTWAKRQRVESSARRRLGMQLHWGEDDLDAAHERMLVEELRPALGAALDELPADQRAAISLRVVDDLSYDEVASRLACTAGAARVRVLRGLRTLRTKLEGDST